MSEGIVNDNEAAIAIIACLVHLLHDDVTITPTDLREIEAFKMIEHAERCEGGYCITLSLERETLNS